MVMISQVGTNPKHLRKSTPDEPRSSRDLHPRLKNLAELRGEVSKVSTGPQQCQTDLKKCELHSTDHDHPGSSVTSNYPEVVHNPGSGTVPFRDKGCHKLRSRRSQTDHNSAKRTSIISENYPGRSRLEAPIKLPLTGPGRPLVTWYF